MALGDGFDTVITHRCKEAKARLKDDIDLLKMEQERGAEGARQALRMGIREILKHSDQARG
jgi:hypothetical protein